MNILKFIAASSRVDTPKAMTLVHCLLICCLLMSSLVFPHICLATDSVAPQRDIAIVKQDATNTQSPAWMTLWEDARALSREQSYVIAAKSYGRLYKLKPNIEEANWEYCKVLLEINDFITAASIIEGLLEKAPNRSDYLLAAGHVALHNQKYDVAVKHFGQVFEKNPVGKEADSALQGLVSSLRNQGKRSISFTLLEQLAQRNPDDFQIVHDLARDAQVLGKKRKVTLLYERLLEFPELDDRIVFQAAHVFERSGDIKKAAELWLEYINRHPDYSPFRKKLAEFYNSTSSFEQAVVHYSYLAEHSADKDEYLLVLGEINLYQLNRADKALLYLEQYIERNPSTTDVQAQIANIQTVLANDFISIVENDGAWLLWRDLAAIAPNRLAIYLEMAEILKEKGKIKELIEILTIVFVATPDDNNIAFALAGYLTDVREFEKALEYINEIPPENGSTRVYLLKADILKKLGLELAELEARKKALSLTPSNHQLRRTCIELAGKLGLVKQQIDIFIQAVQLEAAMVPPNLVYKHLYYLIENQMFDESESTILFGRNIFRWSDEVLARLTFYEAKSARKSGQTRRAERILRSMLHDKLLLEEALLALAMQSTEDGNFDDARIWKEALGKEIELPEKQDRGPALLRKSDLVEPTILMAEGRYKDALDILDHRLGAITSDSQNDRAIRSLNYELLKQKSWLNLHLGEFQKAYSLVKKLGKQSSFDPELLVLMRLIEKKLPGDANQGSVEDGLTLRGNLVPSRLLATISIALKNREYEGAQLYLNNLFKICPGSINGKIFLAELFSSQGKFESAKHVLLDLSLQFHDEIAFKRKLLRIEMKLGEYGNGLYVLLNDIYKIESADDLSKELKDNRKYDDLVTLARLLWSEKDHSLALSVYELLLQPSAVQLLTEKFRTKQINYRYLSQEDSFWNSLMYLVQSEPDIIAELMEPSFLLDNRANDAGRIVSECFEEYSWQKFIQNEYLARKAIYKRKYFYAEQSYKQILQQQDPLTGMLDDLASIYERMGEYRKEAKVYDAIQNSGSSSNELLSSIERTSVAMSPLIGLDGAWSQKSGRDGYIDMVQSSMGASYLATPNLNTDIQLQYEKRNYDSVDDDVNSDSHYVFWLNNFEFADDYEFSLGLGAEKLDGDGNASLLYKMELAGQLDDYLRAYLRIENEPVTDTVYAINEQIYSRSIETGFNVETSIGISIGGDLKDISLSDGNSKRKYHGFSTYNIFGEAIELILRYDYQFLSSSRGNGDIAGSDNDGLVEPLFYWSPLSYSEHLTSLWFQHHFLEVKRGDRLSKSYYKLNVGVGYEDNSNLSYSGGGDIFLEMSPHFLFNGKFSLATVDDYNEARLSISLNYRW